MSKFLCGLVVGISFTVFIWYASASIITDWPNSWIKQQDGTKTYEIVIGWKDRGMPGCSSSTSAGDGFLILTNSKEEAEQLRSDVISAIQTSRFKGWPK